MSRRGYSASETHMSLARSYAYVLYNYAPTYVGGPECQRVLAMGVYTLCMEFNINRYYDLDYLLYYAKDVSDKIRRLKAKGRSKDRITRILYDALAEALTRKYKPKRVDIHGMQADLYCTKHLLHRYICTEQRGAVLKRYTGDIKLPEPMNIRKVRRWANYNFHDLRNEPTAVRERIVSAIHDLVKAAHIERFDDLNYYIYYANHRARVGMDYTPDGEPIGETDSDVTEPIGPNLDPDMVAVLHEMSVHRFSNRWSVYVEIKTELFYKYLMEHMVDTKLPNDPLETLAWIRAQKGPYKHVKQ